MRPMKLHCRQTLPDSTDSKVRSILSVASCHLQSLQAVCTLNFYTAFLFSCLFFVFSFCLFVSVVLFLLNILYCMHIFYTAYRYRTVSY